MLWWDSNQLQYQHARNTEITSHCNHSSNKLSSPKCGPAAVKQTCSLQTFNLRPGRAKRIQFTTSSRPVYANPQ